MRGRGYAKMKDVGRCANCPCDERDEPENPLEKVLEDLEWECSSFLIAMAETAPRGLVHDISNNTIRDVAGVEIVDAIVCKYIKHMEHRQIISWLMQDECLTVNCNPVTRFDYYNLTRRGVDEAIYRLWDRLHMREDACGKRD